MARKKLHEAQREVWALVRKQHGVVTRAQLLACGLTSEAIDHRLQTGRLHRLHRGVYAVGRPEVTRCGRWMAAVLACGPAAALSHESAAALRGIHADGGDAIHVSVPIAVVRRPPGLHVHRRRAFGDADVTRHRGIPVTSIVRTLADLATRLDREEMEAAINEADKRDQIDPEALRSALAGLRGQPGVRTLGQILDRRTFTLTDSELERRFLPIARRAGLPRPQSGVRVNGFKVDFFWPDLGLVVETDGLRYHRTPAQQARDRVRDQAHTAAGLTPLRFTRAQVRFEPAHVEATLTAVAQRLRRRP